MGKREHLGDGEHKELLTVEEAARRLGVGRTFLYDLIRRDEIVSLKLGKKLRRLTPEALRDWVARTQAEQGF